MKIYIPEAKEVLVNDSSYCYQGLCEVGQLNATFSLAEFIVFPVGSYCIVEGMRYTLTKPENVTMVHTRNYEYTLLMYDVSYLLDMYKLHNSVDRRLKYEMVAQPQEFIAELVANMNERGDEQWAVGDCLTGVEHLLAFSHNSIREALQMIADAWKTEWSVGMITDHAGDTTYRLNLKKIECNKGTTNGVADAPVLSYGKGKGFLSGVKRDNDSSSQEIFRMYVQGGERNIDRSKYISPYLLLPVNAQYKHEDRTYEVSTDRYYIYNVSKGDKGYEATFDCADVYPSRVGVVSGVEQDKEFYNIVDKDIALTLNYEKCKMAGEKMSVIFQSGMLAGREFDVSKYEQIRNASGQYFGGRFLLCQQDSDGVNMPSGAFVPAVGDKYVVFGIKMPDEYICKDNPHMVGTKAINGIGAEWELFKEACRNMYENEYQKYTFSGELDSIYLRDKWFNIGSKIVVGGYILFTAPFTKEGGELIRITGVKRYINDPYKIELTLSNGMASTSFGTTIDRIETEPIITASGNKSTLRYARRRFADAQETAKMLEASLLDKFTNGITPITVQTMQLLVGSEQLQFAFYEDVEEENRVDLPVVWDKTKKTLTVKCAGLFAFYSTQSKELTPNKPTYMWRLTNDFAKTLGDDVAKNGYYLYLIGREIGGDVQDDEAVFFLTTSPIPYSNANGYALLVGILNSEYDGERSFAPMHGFTEILPGRVATDKVVSSDGLSYFDMRNNAMQLFKKGKNARLSWDKGELEIVGRIRQMSGDGATYEIGVFKGDYNASTTYYRGDDVLFSYAGAVATYRFTSDAPTADIPPVGREDSRLFWKIVAMGANGANGIPGVDGKDGKDVEFIYTRTDDDAPPDAFEEPTDKTMDDYIPAGWTDNPTGVNSEYGWEWVCKRIKVNGLWGAFSAPALWAKYSRNGQQGAQGAPIVYRGKYVATETYYGAPYRLDVVKYNDMYFVTRNNAGEFRGVAPTDVNKWNTFGAQFSSVATGLLIADMANIAGWNFFNDIIKSQNSTLDLDGKIGELAIKRDGEKVGKLDTDGLTLYGDMNKPLRPTVQIVPGDIEELEDIGSKSESLYLGDPANGIIPMQVGTKVTMEFGKVFVQTKYVDEIVRYSITLSSGGKSITSSAYFVNKNNYEEQFDVPIDLTKEILTVGEDGIVTVEVSRTDNVIFANLSLLRKYENSYGTVIGKNGMYSFMGNNRYLYISENQPPTIRNGNFGLKVADDGIKKWNGSNWVTANI